MTDGHGTALSLVALHGPITVERDLTALPDRVYGTERGARS